MKFRKAIVLFDLEHQLDGVDVAFRSGGMQIYHHVMDATRIPNGSELIVDVGDFAGWRDITTIDVTWLDTGEKQIFVVKKTRRSPALDGKLATYPV